jgi:7tm Odorant receptor
LIVLPIYTGASFVFIITAAELAKNIHYKAIRSFNFTLCVILIILMIIFYVTSTGLSDAAYNLANAFYSTNWVDESPDFKNIVLNAIREAQQISNLNILCYNNRDVSFMFDNLIPVELSFFFFFFSGVQEDAYVHNDFECHFSKVGPYANIILE